MQNFQLRRHQKTFGGLAQNVLGWLNHADRRTWIMLGLLLQLPKTSRQAHC